MSRLNTLLGLGGGGARRRRWYGAPAPGSAYRRRRTAASISASRRRSPQGPSAQGMPQNMRLKQILALRAQNGDSEAARVLGHLMGLLSNLLKPEELHSHERQPDRGDERGVMAAKAPRNLMPQNIDRVQGGNRRARRSSRTRWLTADPAPIRRCTAAIRTTRPLAHSRSPSTSSSSTTTQTRATPSSCSRARSRFRTPRAQAPARSRAPPSRTCSATRRASRARATTTRSTATRRAGEHLLAPLRYRAPRPERRGGCRLAGHAARRQRRPVHLERRLRRGRRHRRRRQCGEQRAHELLADEPAQQADAGRRWPPWRCVMAEGTRRPSGSAARHDGEDLAAAHHPRAAGAGPAGAAERAAARGDREVRLEQAHRRRRHDRHRVGGPTIRSSRASRATPTST
jgi:hypothetical protein